MDHLKVTIGDFRKKVLDKKNEIPDEVFLVSEAARHYIENMVEAVTKQFNNKIHVVLEWGKPDGYIAYANDRKELHINVNNPFVTGRADRPMKLVITKALGLHESGHLLFTDFHILKSTRQVFLENRKLFPAPKCPEYDEWQTDAIIMNDAQIQAWFKIWKAVENSIEDGFIEYMILNLVPGDGKCLLSLRELQKAEDISVKQQRANGLPTKQILFNMLLMLSKYGSVKMDADDKSDPAIAELIKEYDLIQKATREQRSYDRLKLINELFCKLYKFFKEEKKKEEEEKQKQEQQQEQQEQNGSSNDASNSQNGQDQADENAGDDSSAPNGEGNSQDEKSDENQGQNGQADDSEDNSESKNSDDNKSDNGSDNEAENSNDNSNSSDNSNPSSDMGTESDSKGAGSNSESTGPADGGIPDPFDIDVPEDSLNDNLDTGSGSVLNDNNINKKSEPQQAKNNQQKLEQMMQDDAPIDAEIPTPEDKRKADSIAEEIAQEEVKKEHEKELAKELQKEVSETDYSSFNKGAKPSLSRKEPTKRAYEQYEEDYDAIKNDVKKLVREIRNKIKDRQNGGKLNGLYQGRYLDINSLYRFDQRIFCKNDLPQDIPNMAFSLVVDASGSMRRGEKMTYARRTALLLYLFGRELNVPVMVYSHNSSSRDCDMQALADFGSVDGKDKYRICDYSPSNCNRDGMALRFCSKKLSERPEETKICFIISDGLPSAYDNQVQAYGDIKDCLMEYSKKGVRYIACGLGNDAAHIKDIYQQGLSPKVRAEFLDCTDPSKLPVAIVRSIRELIN